MSPQPLPREHGTMRGYGQHARLREPECEDCAEASRRHQRDRRDRQRQELAARRARWRQQDGNGGEIATTTD